MPAERPTTPAAGAPPDPGAGARWERRAMFALRYVLPAVTVLGGAVVMAFGSEVDLEGGAGIVSAGLAIYGMNWLYRASIEGDRVRVREAAARDYFAAHGHWPDEAPRTARAVHAPSAPARPGTGTSPATRPVVGAPPARDKGRLAGRPLRSHTSYESRRRSRG